MQIKSSLASVIVLALFAAAPALAAQKSFSLASQPVSTAIQAYAQQAGVQIIAPDDGAGEVMTQAVEGLMDARQALLRMLEGTGLEIASDDGRIIVLRRSKPLRSGTPDPEALLDTIVVTAQKRVQPAQDVPISLTAYSARQIDQMQLQSLRDVSRLTPGLLVSSFSQANPTIAVRGANNTFSQIGVNKPVAIVVDDVFVPRNSAATFDLYRLQSIQVLKGPQGTLFGRNATGSTIVIDSGKPAYGQSSGSIQTGFGNHGLHQIDALADIASGDAAAFRLAGSFKAHDGYGRDRLTGNEQDDMDSRNLRGQARFQASDYVEVLLGADWSSDENGGRTLSSKTLGADGDRRTSEVGVPQGFEREQWGVSSRIYWDSGIGKFTSITGYRHTESGERYSGVGAHYQFLGGTTRQATTQDNDDVSALSQELRYASPVGERGDFVAGLYLLDEDAKRALFARDYAAVSGTLANHVLADQQVRTKSYAGFIDGNLRLSDQWSLTLGTRYTYDRKTASLIRTDFLNPRNSFAMHGLDASWNELTSRAVLSWKPSSRMMLYASATQGYTSGGFNTEASSVAALSRPFDPETVTNVELGMKSQWLDDRLRLNATTFRMKYKDKQELYFDGITRILNIENAGEATVQGAELELEYRPVKAFGLMASYGWLDTRYDRFVIPGGADNTGHPMGSSPKNKWALATDFRFPLANGGHLIGAASYAYTGDYYTGATMDPNLFIRGYGLGNAQLGYESADGRWRLAGWVRNIADTEYVLIPSTQVVLSEYLGEPRTYGVSFTLNFGGGASR